MANTTNYNWETPDDTDLVKDGASAIRSLGTAIDTTVFNNASAAIAKTIVDAKGDIIAATAADTVARLAVGANDTVLTADSSTATGLKWATPASGSTFTGVSLYKSANQSIANNTFVLITFDTEYFDTDTFHSTSTNTSRITIPSGKGGYYNVSATLSFGANATGVRQLNLLKNGTAVQNMFATSPTGGGGDYRVSGSTILSLVAGDYIEINGYQTSGGALDVQGFAAETTFGAFLIGA